MPEPWASIALANAGSCGARFGSSADPFEIVDVNPRGVRRVCLAHSATGREKGSKYHDWGTVMPGDWDIAWRGSPNPPVAETVKWKAVVDRYVHRMSWEATGIIDHLAPGDEGRGRFKTREDVIERYHLLDQVFEDIRTRGFRLTQEVDEDVFSNLFVSIGRRGELLHAKGGSHRLAIAVILGLPTIPMYVLSRHEEWQRLRERLGSVPRPDPPFQHPDLRGLSR